MLSGVLWQVWLKAIRGTCAYFYRSRHTVSTCETAKNDIKLNVTQKRKENKIK
jgi:hypothetical protein